MKTNMPPLPSEPLRLVPYRQTGEPPRKAAVLRVDFPFEDVSGEELNLLGTLSEAADCMNSVAVRQLCPETERIAETLERMLSRARDEKDDEAVRALDDYLDVLAMQNSPWSDLPRKNHLLALERDKARCLAERTGVSAAFESLEPYFYEDRPLPERAAFYPSDLSEEEFAALGPEARRVNTAVVRGEDGKPRVVVNEVLYRQACAAAADRLKEARAFVKDPGFLLYLDAKIEELRAGTEEARRIADYFWIRHNHPVDFILSTAVEVYADGWKNLKGQAAAAVLFRSREAEVLLVKLVALVPELERTAPWTWRRTEIDPATLPKIKFVDVLSWTGDYVSSPLTTLAQSLPNDDWTGKNVGTVNLVYRNTGKAVHGVSSGAAAEEFLPAAVLARCGGRLFEAGQLHSTLHEIGHTTGRQDPDHPGEPNTYLGNEYSFIEEARAELFGLWSAEAVAERGLVDAETAFALPYARLLSLVLSLKFDPVQAHYRARNAMYHFFRERGAVVEAEDPAKSRRVFDIEPSAFSKAVRDLLKIVGDLKASGDYTGASAFAVRYCFTDPLKDEIEERTKDLPLGRALVFPELRRGADGSFSRTVRWPEFRRQRKFL